MLRLVFKVRVLFATHFEPKVNTQIKQVSI